MNEPLVSVVVITYNHEPYIKECIDGIISQKTDFPIEILVNDDCSTDNTASIIEEYELKYPSLFRCIYQSENQYSKGVHPWFDILFPIAKGKYIALCEGDDYWIDPYKLQKQVDFMEKHTEYSMCFHNVDVLSNIEEEKNLFNHLETRYYEDSDILNKWTVPTCSVLYRNNLLKQNLNYKMIVFGDIFLFLRLSQYGKLYCINEKMAIYRRLSNGISTIKRDICQELSIYKKIAIQYFYMSKYFKTNVSVSNLCKLWCNKFCNYVIYNNQSRKSDRLYLITIRYFADKGVSIKDYISLIYTYVIK